MSTAPCTAYVSPSTLSRLTAHSTSDATSITVSIQVLAAPTTKNVPISGSEAAASQSTPLAAAKQLLLNSNGTRNAVNEQEGRESEKKHVALERISVRPLLGVPERHVVITGQLPRSDMEDWDLVS